MSYGDIVGRLIKVLANEGTSKLEHIIKSSQQSQTASGVWDFVLNFSNKTSWQHDWQRNW